MSSRNPQGGSPPDTLSAALKTYLAGQQEAMRDALRRLVLIPSGTGHKAGVDALCREVYALLDGLPLERRILPQGRYGDMLIAAVPPAERAPRILLAGHMDTIFPVDSPFCGWREDERHFSGPGVVDMKGGLVAGIFALRALDSLGLLGGLPVTWIFNSEEEVGSPVSRELFAAEAKRSAMAFVLEPGGRQGGIVTGRKGRLGMRIVTRGVAGHAATAEEGKRSAILDLARVICELEGLNGACPGVSVNVGLMAGGITPNSVPAEAWATIDVRSPSGQGFAFFRSRLGELLERRGKEGMELEVERVTEVPVMEATELNRALFAVIAREARRLGIPAREQFRPGASDGNFIAAAGTPVVDGLGPIGGDGHSDREYLLRESLPERSALLALSLVAAWRLYAAGTLFAGSRPAPPESDAACDYDG
ncbi:MAG: M20/M25/M40 family metallo-hydrolase [Syntrophales bacterium]